MIYCGNCKQQVEPRTNVDKQISCICPSCDTLIGSIEIPRALIRPQAPEPQIETEKISFEKVASPVVEIVSKPEKETRPIAVRTRKKATQ